MAEGSPYPLAAFRISFGLYLLAYWLAYLGKVNVVFSSEGITIPYLIPDWSLPPVLCTALFTFFLLAIGALIVGYRTAWITPLVLLLYLYFYFLSVAVRNTAYDRLNLIFLGILCLGKLDGVWAPWPESRRAVQPVPVGVWPQRMIMMQLCFVYFGSGLWKFANRHWHTGDMLYYTLIGSWGTPLAFWFANLGLPKWFWAVSTWGIVMWELSMSLLLLYPPFRRIGFIVGFLFHFSVGALLHIWEFFDCVTAYVLFVEADRLRAMGEPVGRFVQHQRSRFGRQGVRSNET
jgi:Vitamin K-dependent gamma-carboxylase